MLEIKVNTFSIKLGQCEDCGKLYPLQDTRMFQGRRICYTCEEKFRSENLTMCELCRHIIPRHKLRRFLGTEMCVTCHYRAKKLLSVVDKEKLKTWINNNNSRME